MKGFWSAQTCSNGAIFVCAYRQANIEYWSHHKSYITQSENLIAGCGSYKGRWEMPAQIENFICVLVLPWNLSSCLNYTTLKMSEIVCFLLFFLNVPKKFDRDWMLSLFLFVRIHISALYTRVVFRLIHGADSIWH